MSMSPCLFFVFRPYLVCNILSLVYFSLRCYLSLRAKVCVLWVCRYQSSGIFVSFRLVSVFVGPWRQEENRFICYKRRWWMMILEDAAWKRWEPEGNSKSGDVWILNIEQRPKWAVLVCPTFWQSFACFPCRSFLDVVFPPLCLCSLSPFIFFTLFSRPLCLNSVSFLSSFSFFPFFVSLPFLFSSSKVHLLPSSFPLFLFPAPPNLHPLLPLLLPSSSFFSPFSPFSPYLRLFPVSSSIHPNFYTLRPSST